MDIEHIKLPDVIDMTSAQSLKEELLRSFHKGLALNVDASMVVRIGTSGLQLLWSAVVSYGASGLGLRVLNPSSAFLAAFEDAGLDISNSFQT